MKVFAAAILLVAAGVGATGWPAGAGAAGGDDPRVLVISVPGLTWQDVENNYDDIPNLARLLDRSGVADLATRTISRRIRLADGYSTFNAGTRAVGAGGADDGEAFAVGEPFGRDSAGRVFERRTGDHVGEGIVVLSLAEILERNAGELYDAEVGALGDALAAAGRPRAVIGNADGFDPPEPAVATYRRTVAEGLMGSDGVVPAGTVGADLLVEDPEAPFGLRLDNEAAAGAFAEVWEPGAVVLVEASDLVREDAYRGFADAEQRPRLFRQALQATDDLVGRLLEEVDLGRDVVLVMGTSHPERQVRLTVAALHEPGGEPGLLRSGSTRRSGFVQLVDLAPTILDRVGVAIPESMEGQPITLGDSGGSASDRRAFLVREDAAATFRDARVGSVATIFVVGELVLALGTMLLVVRPGRRDLARALFAGAIVALAYLPAVWLARLFPFHDWGVVAYFAFLLGVAAVLAATYIVVTRGRRLDTVIVALAVIVVLLLVDVVLGTPLQFNSALGYSPKVAGRFTGFGNLGYAALASSAVLLAGLLAHRIGGRRGARVGVGLLVVVFVIDALPFWGSDVGGTLSILPAYAVASYLLLGARVRARTIVLCGLGAVAAVVVFGLVDLARPADQRSHLGRLFESIADDGFSSLATVILRKAGSNLAALTTSVWMWMVPIALGLLAWLLWRTPGRLRAVYRRIPELGAVTIGFVIVAVLGFALNDTGIAVPGVMLGVATSVFVALVAWSVEEREPGAARQPVEAGS
ncbi:MAG TPA: hypothetical protein VF152_01890 [Acidimicrobiia bacterium]